MKMLDPDLVSISILTPFPPTEVYMQAVKTGLLRDVWREFFSNPSTPFQIPIWPGQFSREELIELLDKGHRKFYLRSSTIFRQMKSIQNWRNMKGKGRIFLKMLINLKKNN